MKLARGVRDLRGGLDPAVLEALVRSVAPRRVNDEQARDEVLGAVRHLVPVGRVELVGRRADLRAAHHVSQPALKGAESKCVTGPSLSWTWRIRAGLESLKKGGKPHRME